MTVTTVYNVYGFLIEKKKVADAISLLSDEQIDKMNIDYDIYTNCCEEFKVHGCDIKFHILNFTHDVIGFDNYCVVGIMLCETPTTTRSKQFFSKNRQLPDEIIQDWSFIERHFNMINKKVQILTYYLTLNNLPFDIISLISDIAISNEDIFIPLKNVPFWSKLICSAKEPDYFVIQDDCDCCT